MTIEDDYACFFVCFLFEGLIDEVNEIYALNMLSKSIAENETETRSNGSSYSLLSFSLCWMVVVKTFV